MDDVAFEAMMGREASAMTYPPTPQLRARVVAAIAAERPAPPWRLMPAPAVAAPFAALIVAAALTMVFAVPGSREAVADFFGIEGSKVEPLPTPRPGETPTPLPTPVGIEAIATPASRTVAAATLGFAPAVPAGEGAPIETYLMEYIERDVVVLHYERFDLWEARLEETEFFAKGLPEGATVRDVVVDGRPARWISGGNHLVRFVGPDGREVVGSQRTVERNTLIWRTEYALYRLETDLPEAEAIRLAESLP